MRLYQHVVCVLGVVVLSACGGGGGGGGGGTSTARVLSGLAATGAALGGATITVKCTAGATATTTTAADGSFSVALGSPQSLPCILKAEKGAITLYSYATAYGRVNLTPLSDLALAAAGHDTPADLFAAFSSALANTISANLATAKTYLSTQMAAAGFNAITIDVLTGAFVVGDAHDQILDQLQVVLVRNTKTLDDLRTLAKTSLALNTALPPGKLVISEVASGYYSDVPFWFEIANVGDGAVNLTGYTVKTAEATLNKSPYTDSGPQTFSLPDISLAPGSFLVVSGQRATPLADTTQVVYISDSGNPNRVPYWTGSGSIELLKSGVTQSFVRFGTNTDTPASGVATTAPALPYSATDYGKAIVLAGKTAADMEPSPGWSSVAWTTPAGPNDVPAGAVDADGDGIPDSAEVPGGSFAGIDLYAMGVRAGQRDILIQVDYMDSAKPGIIPRKEALDKVKAAFAAKNANMVIDVGALFGDAASTGYNWGGGKKVDYAPCVDLGERSGCAGDLYKYKSKSLDVRRASLFHYALFGNSLNNDGSSGSSGIAELPGNDFLVTLGAWSLNTATTASTNTLINYQAGTFMHELGHNLNLQHGGFEGAQYKPNYLSVMNYLYQLYGVGGDARDLGPYQRWKCKTQNNCTSTPMLGAADSNTMAIDYSNGSGADLNENSVQESANVGRGANLGIYADWNFSGMLDGATYAIDLNFSGTKTILKDYDDWSNIVWAFQRTADGAFGARQASKNMATTVLDPMSNDRQPYIVETLYEPRH
jgi:hypothetical protein